MTVNRYRRRPTETEAVQWTGDNAAELEQWCGTTDDATMVYRGQRQPVPVFWVAGGTQPAKLWVAANRSWLPLDVGEWVAKDSKGHYPIKDDVFRSVYEKVEDG